MANITFIGAGNMASSIIGGLLTQDSACEGYLAKHITASDPNLEALSVLNAKFGIQTEADNNQACLNADIIVLAVKPQVLKTVAQSLKATIKPQTLVISIAAGINSDSLSQWLGNSIAIVRCMPNTPALVGKGATGLYANNHVTGPQKHQAEELLNAVGISIWLDSEDLIDSVTAVSGSGPAYFFLFMEAMIEAGIKQGLTAKQARQLTLQTAAGAATLAQQSDVDVAELRRRVTSPGGTTEQAVLSFEKSGLRKIVDNAMVACAERSQTMAVELS
ncbi:MAG: pyrroline-5-carboxylate reductase [Cellvibrionaceae bacterium]|jgi:pyrroline-5-carboxylate reductase